MSTRCESMMHTAGKTTQRSWTRRPIQATPRPSGQGSKRRRMGEAAPAGFVVGGHGSDITVDGLVIDPGADALGEQSGIFIDSAGLEQATVSGNYVWDDQPAPTTGRVMTVGSSPPCSEERCIIEGNFCTGFSGDIDEVPDDEWHVSDSEKARTRRWLLHWRPPQHPSTFILHPSIFNLGH